MTGLLTATTIDATTVESTTYQTPSNAGDIVHKTAGALPSIGIFSTGEAGLVNSSNKGNIQIGDNVMPINTSGGNNVVMGNNIATVGTAGNSSVMIGEQILEVLVTLGVNIMMGRELGELATSASNNVVMGYRCLEEASTISSSVVLGRDCLSKGGGVCDDTVSMGHNTGVASGAGSYNRCLLIGSQSLESTSASMTNVVKLGYGITTTNVADNTCIIGDQNMNVIQNNGDAVCDLGSTTNQFKDIHLDGDVAFGGDAVLTSPGKYLLDRPGGGSPLPIVYSVFSQTNETTVANSATEDELIGASTSVGEGTLAIPANAFGVGAAVKFTCSGTCDNAGAGQDPVFRLYLGANLIGTMTVDMAGVVANSPWKIDSSFTIKSIGVTGSVSGTSFFTYMDNATLKGDASSETSVYNSTIVNDFRLTCQWANANVNNTITCACFCATICYQ